MKIKVKKLKEFTQTKIYPVCKTSQFFANLAGESFLSENTLTKIRRYGYKIIDKSTGEILTCF
jgi:hypothetical protein